MRFLAEPVDIDAAQSGVASFFREELTDVTLSFFANNLEPAESKGDETLAKALRSRVRACHIRKTLAAFDQHLLGGAASRIKGKLKGN